MIAAILAILKRIWPTLAGAAVAIFGLLLGWAKGKAADTKVAQAGQREAEARAQTAETLNAEAQADAAAKQTGLDAAAVRQQIEADTAAKSSSEVQNDLDTWRK